MSTPNDTPAPGGETAPGDLTPEQHAASEQANAYTRDLLAREKPALAYLLYFPAMRDVARQHGYALAIHGSLTRDFDLVAVPWTAEASDADTLVAAICADNDLLLTVPDDGRKPHGRRGYTLQGIAGVPHGWVDLSVMPRARRADDLAYLGLGALRVALERAKQNGTGVSLPWDVAAAVLAQYEAAIDRADRPHLAALADALDEKAQTERAALADTSAGRVRAMEGVLREARVFLGGDYFGHPGIISKIDAALAAAPAGPPAQTGKEEAQYDQQLHHATEEAALAAMGDDPVSRCAAICDDIERNQQPGRRGFFLVSDVRSLLALAAAPAGPPAQTGEAYTGERADVLAGFPDPATVKVVARQVAQAVEAELPEDEPDYTAPWVYETAVRVAMAAAVAPLSNILATPRAAPDEAGAVTRCASRHPLMDWQCGDVAGHTGDHTVLIPSGVPWAADRAARATHPGSPLKPHQTMLNDLRDALRIATIRLGILRDRMAGCTEDHAVSLAEVPAWISEQEAALAAAASDANARQAGYDHGYRRAFAGITRRGGMYVRLFDALELAWGLIANAANGDWTKETPLWRHAAEQWRDQHWHPLLDERAWRRIGMPTQDDVAPITDADLDAAGRAYLKGSHAGNVNWAGLRAALEHDRAVRQEREHA